MGVFYNGVASRHCNVIVSVNELIDMVLHQLCSEFTACSHTRVLLCVSSYNKYKQSYYYYYEVIISSRYAITRTSYILLGYGLATEALRWRYQQVF